MKFKFDLKRKVKISTSGEQGEVIGRAEFSEASNTYQVRYKAGDGRAAEVWWNEEALEEA